MSKIKDSIILDRFEYEIKHNGKERVINDFYKNYPYLEEYFDLLMEESDGDLTKIDLLTE